MGPSSWQEIDHELTRIMHELTQMMSRIYTNKKLYWWFFMWLVAKMKIWGRVYLSIRSGDCCLPSLLMTVPGFRKVLNFFRRAFVLSHSEYNTDNTGNQKNAHRYVIYHVQSSLSIFNAKVNRIITTIVPKIIFGKSTNLGVISEPNIWVSITSLPISSAIRESFSLCRFVSFITNIIQQTKMFVKQKIDHELTRIISKMNSNKKINEIFVPYCRNKEVLHTEINLGRVIFVRLGRAFFFPIFFKNKNHKDYCCNNPNQYHNSNFIHFSSPSSNKYPVIINSTNHNIPHQKLNSETFSGDRILPAINIAKIICAKLKESLDKLDLRFLVSCANNIIQQIKMSVKQKIRNMKLPKRIGTVPIPFARCVGLAFSRCLSVGYGFKKIRTVPIFFTCS